MNAREKERERERKNEKINDYEQYKYHKDIIWF